MTCQSPRPSGPGDSVDRPLVPIIVGPTAVGKTALALAIARRCNIAVISADSRQVYRSLDVGTAKPTRTERSAVPHLGLDLIDPGEVFSAGQFARRVEGWLKELDQEAQPARQPVIVGGTGLYLRALTHGLFVPPAIPTEKRRQLRKWLGTLPEVERWAQRLDPAVTGGGRQRAARSVEVALLTGCRLSWWQRTRPAEPKLAPWYIRLVLTRDELHRRIEARVADMLQGGWIDEVRSILDGGIAPTAAGLDAVGYREVVQHVRGEIGLSDLHRVITHRTRQYAKRQSTWFNHQLGAHPTLQVDASETSPVLAERIINAWRAR